MTNAEKNYLDRVADLGCLICKSPAEIHHPRFAGSMGKRSAHWLAIPLCPEHHRLGGNGVALHAGQRTFEGLYGTEEQLLSETIKRLFSHG